MTAAGRLGMLAAAVRLPPAARAAAGIVVTAGVAAPLLRRRLRLPPFAVLSAAALAPVATCVLVPRTRARDAAVCALQMWAYLAAYEIPYDDPAALERRVHVTYPVRIDRALGLGAVPSLRLQRLFGAPGRFSALEKVLVWSHWSWFLVPHGTVLYLLLAHRERFAHGAALMYATFDVGVVAYWLVPTAPPWYAAARGLLADGRTPELRRMMVEYGARFWRSRWQRLYGFLGGNPLAAMPSLHFATSVMAAHLLAATGRVAGALGCAYAATLGLALVYLGEHYVVDLAAGLALAEGVRAAAPRVTPAAEAVAAAVRALEARAGT
jgi:hypothetical protein